MKNSVLLFTGNLSNASIKRISHKCIRRHYRFSFGYSAFLLVPCFAHRKRYPLSGNCFSEGGTKHLKIQRASIHTTRRPSLFYLLDTALPLTRPFIFCNVHICLPSVLLEDCGISVGFCSDIECLPPGSCCL